MTTTKTIFAPYFVLALALIGIADASYDSYAIYTGQLLWCPPPIDGCNIVAGSPYARVRGVPVGYLGVLYYVCMFGLAAMLVRAPSSRGWSSSVFLSAAFGVLFSLYFMYIQVTFIRAFCIYCVISGLLTLLLLFVALAHAQATRRSTAMNGKNVSAAG